MSKYSQENSGIEDYTMNIVTWSCQGLSWLYLKIVKSTSEALEWI